jgi:hypothetical protein
MVSNYGSSRKRRSSGSDRGHLTKKRENVEPLTSEAQRVDVQPKVLQAAGAYAATRGTHAPRYVALQPEEHESRRIYPREGWPNLDSFFCRKKCPCKGSGLPLNQTDRAMLARAIVIGGRLLIQLTRLTANVAQLFDEHPAVGLVCKKKITLHRSTMERETTAGDSGKTRPLSLSLSSKQRFNKQWEITDPQTSIAIPWVLPARTLSWKMGLRRP